MKTQVLRIRRYSARYCACGKQASCVIQALARTLGPGQSKFRRSLKVGVPVMLCASCARNATAFAGQLRDSGSAALERITVQSIAKDSEILPLF
jgi:hypothetical protein